MLVAPLPQRIRFVWYNMQMSAYTKIVLTSGLLFLAIGLLHIVAILFFIYFEYWWFDIPMHLLGGMFASLFSVLIAFALGRMRENVSLWRVYMVAVLGTLLIGGLWEVYEYLTDRTFNGLGNYPLDTAKDFLVDVLGAGIGCRLLKRFLSVS